MITKKGVNIIFVFLICIMTFSCTNKKEAQLLYSGDTFKIYADSVSQPPYSAKVITATEIISDYKSPFKIGNPNKLEFKFAINGNDNELPFGMNHSVYLPVNKPEIVFDDISFGRRYVKSGYEGNISGNVAVTFRLDMRHVLNSFEEQGYYQLCTGSNILKQEFKGVWIAGSISPLNWDFGNLAKNNKLKLQDDNKDGIYEITIRFYADKNSFSDTNKWQLNCCLADYPQFYSEQLISEALYNLAIDELTKNITHEKLFDTGEKWKGVWTRDVSFSILLALAITNPEISKNSLMKKVANGKIIQDTGTGGSWPVSSDRLAWALAAWEIFTFTGDITWLNQAYNIIKKSIDDDFHVVYDKSTHLIRGESSFLDWREQSYPQWMQPIDIYNSQCLGTNAIYYKAYLILADMAKMLNKDWKIYSQKAEKLKKAIDNYFWIEDKAYYGQFLYGKSFLSLSPKPETLGGAFCVLFNIASRDQEKSMIENSPALEYGNPCFYPQIPGIKAYHNNAVWPFVQAFHTWAAAQAGNERVVGHGLASMYRQAGLFLSNKENFNAGNGDENATAINSDRQLWSVAGNLAMVYRVFFGMQIQPYKLILKPTIPSAYKGIKTLKNFKYRDGIYNIEIRGTGKNIKAFTIDNKEYKYPIIPSDMKGRHSIVIQMDNQPFNHRPINLVKNKFTPKSPKLERENNLLIWNKIANAAGYEVFINGKTVANTKSTFYPIENDSIYQEFQVRSIDNDGNESFLSKPVCVYNKNERIILDVSKAAHSAGQVVAIGASGNGFVEVRKKINTQIDIPFTINKTGNFLLDFRYANGNGPINTDNKCAIRTLLINGKNLGSIVMPQRGINKWNDWGYTNSFRIKLNEGHHIISIVFKDYNENMNRKENTALIDYARLIRL